MDNNIEEKLRNLEEWKKERAKIKPFIDTAVEHHNKARNKARWRDHETADYFYKEAIKNYRGALAQNPRYYLQDLLDRVDHVIEEYINNTFDLRVSGDNLKSESGIEKLVNFVDNLKQEERRYIDPYNIAQAYILIADFYCEDRNLGKALEFYNMTIDTDCNRPFINSDAYLKMGRILFEQSRFKEALVSFVAVLSFDRGNKEAIDYLKDCLKRLGILEHKDKFLRATPNEAKKLIMEVL